MCGLFRNSPVVEGPQRGPWAVGCNRYAKTFRETKQESVRDRDCEEADQNDIDWALEKRDHRPAYRRLTSRARRPGNEARSCEARTVTDRFSHGQLSLV